MTSVLVEPGKPATLVDVDWSQIQSTLGCVSFAYPSEDPVAFAHDDDGIQNGRLPNRTVNGQIIPGPFYILQDTLDGHVMGLSQSLAEKYLEMYSTPEKFPSPGHWVVTTSTEDQGCFAVIKVVSAWVPGLICPRCGKEYFEHPALSRSDNSTPICPRCGSEEALIAAGMEKEAREKILEQLYPQESNPLKDGGDR